MKKENLSKTGKEEFKIMVEIGHDEEFIKFHFANRNEKALIEDKLYNFGGFAENKKIKIEEMQQENKKIKIKFMNKIRFYIKRLRKNRNYLEFLNSVVITKDNIHLYYEFMSDEDLVTHKDVLFFIFSDRSFYVSSSIKLPEKSISFNSKVLSILGIKDTLKPIDEYIADIKASDAYREYIAKSDNKKIYDMPFGQINKDDTVKLKSSDELFKVKGLYWNTNEVKLSNEAVVQMRDIEYISAKTV